MIYAKDARRIASKRMEELEQKIHDFIKEFLDSALRVKITETAEKGFCFLALSITDLEKMSGIPKEYRSIFLEELMQKISYFGYKCQIDKDLNKFSIFW